LPLASRLFSPPPHDSSSPRSIYRDLNGGRAPPPAHRGLIGTCSAAVVLTLTLPLEVVRRRLQVQVRCCNCRYC